MSMQFVKRDGVNLAYRDNRQKGPPIVLIHGWGCDHTSFSPQAGYFGSTHRVISVDLRGHGQSAAPDEDYSMPAYADDVAWLCAELGLIKPLIAGHSMGGNVALELAARYPEIPSAIVLIDSIFFPRPTSVSALQPLLAAAMAAVQAPDYAAACRQVYSAMCLAADDETIKRQLIASLPAAPRHVLASLANQLPDYDPTSPAAGCRVPVAYIAATGIMADLAHFRSLAPQLLTAQTLGSGHFSPLFAPDQINAMLSTFLKVYSPGLK